MIPFAFFSKLNRRIVLIVFVLFLNIFAVKKAVAIFADDNYVKVVCLNIPGGNMAMVKSGGTEIDLIINGIQGKTYNIDEKIMIPNINEEKVKKIDKLFVLKSDFSAVDDVLRIAEHFEVNRLFLPHELELSFTDQIINLQKENLLQKLVLIQKSEIGDSSSGYFLHDNGFSLISPRTHITFVDKISPFHLKQIPNEATQYLVIGSTWNISVNDYLHLKDLGYETVICSKIVQDNFSRNPGVEEMSTDLLVNLYNTPKYSIKLIF